MKTFSVRFKMRKKLFILILAFLLVFILSSSGWSLQRPWQYYARYEHTWEDACKVIPNNNSDQHLQTVKMIINIPLFLPSNFQLLIITAHKGDMNLKERGNNYPNQSFSRKWVSGAQNKPRR